MNLLKQKRLWLYLASFLLLFITHRNELVAQDNFSISLDVDNLHNTGGRFFVKDSSIYLLGNVNSKEKVGLNAVLFRFDSTTMSFDTILFSDFRHLFFVSWSISDSLIFGGGRSFYEDEKHQIYQYFFDQEFNIIDTLVMEMDTVDFFLNYDFIRYKDHYYYTQLSWPDGLNPRYMSVVKLDTFLNEIDRINIDDSLHYNADIGGLGITKDGNLRVGTNNWKFGTGYLKRVHIIEPESMETIWEYQIVDGRDKIENSLTSHTELSDGTIIMSNQRDTVTFGWFYQRVVAFDPYTSMPKWSYKPPRLSEKFGVHALKDDHILLIGFSERYDLPYFSMEGFVAKISPEGEELWRRYITDEKVRLEDGEVFCAFLDVLEADNGDLYFTGAINQKDDSDIWDMWFLKLDSNGCYDPDNCSEVYHINGVNPSTSDTEKLPSPYSLYPNPVGDVLHIDSEISYSGFRIYDLLGRERLRLDKMVDQVDVSSLESGAYFITFLSKNQKIETLKWIKR